MPQENLWSAGEMKNAPSELASMILKKRAREIRAVIRDVKYPGWRFEFSEQRFYIQGRFLAEHISTRKVEEQFTRKWYISAHATKNEIVQTCLKCVLAALEHEARENFRYKGAAIYGPHFDPDALSNFCKQPEALEAR
jgi:hypothetical protein